MFSVLSSLMLFLRLSKKTKIKYFQFIGHCLTGYVHKGYSRKAIWPGMVVPACYLNTQEAEAEGLLQV